MTVESAPKRPWLAALLALVYPGLGHVYLREWARALLWFGLVIAATSLLLPESVVPATMSFESVRRAASELPARVALVLVFLTGLNTADAYRIAARSNRQRERVEDGQSCPDCGRELDGGLEFCHWCTAELDGGEERSA